MLYKLYLTNIIFFSFIISCDFSHRNSNMLFNKTNQSIDDKSILRIEYDKRSDLNYCMVKLEEDQKIEYIETIKLKYTEIEPIFKKINKLLNNYIDPNLGHIIKQFCFGEHYKDFDFKKNQNLETAYIMSISSKKQIFDFVFLNDIQICFCKISNNKLVNYIFSNEYNFSEGTNFLGIENLNEENLPKELSKHNINIAQSENNKSETTYLLEHIEYPIKTLVYKLQNKEGLFFIKKNKKTYPLYLRARNLYNPLCNEVISYPNPKYINSYFSYLFNINIRIYCPEVVLLIPNFSTKQFCAYPDSLLDDNIDNLNYEEVYNLHQDQRESFYFNYKNFDLNKFKKENELTNFDNNIRSSLFKLTLVYFKHNKLNPINFKNSKLYIDDMKSEEERLEFFKKINRDSLIRRYVKFHLKKLILVSFAVTSVNIFLKRAGYLKKGNDYIYWLFNKGKNYFQNKFI